MSKSTKLVMSFKTSLDRKISISLEDPRDDVSKADIKAVMDMIVARNIFAISGGDIVESVDAKVIQTNTTDYDVVVF